MFLIRLVLLNDLEYNKHMGKTANSNLHKAKKAKEDEFYTRLEDIERELSHYSEHFKNKVVFCNCDDPESSNFWRYFELNFEHLGLKKLISTHYDTNGPTYKLELTQDSDRNGDGKVDGQDVLKTPLQGNGDFRSPECLELLKEADIVVTNPPFSLFREYVTQLIESDKRFLIVGPGNAITYKDIFPLIMSGKLWLGHKNGDMSFRVPDHYEPRATRFWIDESGQKWRSMGNICWFTNLDHSKRHEEIPLFRSYSPEEYPTYDNYDAINVSKVKDIPVDWSGPMGVPITFLDKWNPNQFEIVDANSIRQGAPQKPHGLIKDKDGAINGKPKYARIVVRNKNPHLGESP